MADSAGRHEWSARKINSPQAPAPASSRKSNVFTIAPGGDFLHVLVDNLINGNLVRGFSPIDDPLLLSTATIFVPNRRAGRALATAFLGVGSADASILPTIRMLGDVGDEAFGFGGAFDEQLDLADTIHPRERQLELANLIDCWRLSISAEMRALLDDEEITIPASKADAIGLADDLCRLLDQMTLEEISWSAIGEIIPDDRDWAEWWRLTATFLKIVMENWPEHLEARGLMDPADRQARLLDRRTSGYEKHGSGGPVIVAGSTGSVPATQRLLKAVAGLENGVIVLPGLDQHMQLNEWQCLTSDNSHRDASLETHPQFGLAQLVAKLGLDRADVVELAELAGSLEERRQLVSLALAPADATADWHGKALEFETSSLSEALQDITIIDAPSERQEALAIAVSMREVLEQPRKTAALVTPDRNLARRVSMELQRFGIEVDDTGGTPLKTTPVTLFLRNVIDVCFGEGGNVAVAALIKSPFCLAGSTVVEARHHARNFEIIALRGTIQSPQPGAFWEFLIRQEEVLATAQHVHPAARRIDEPDRAAVLDHVSSIDCALKPLISLQQPQSLSTLFGILGGVADELSRNDVGETSLLDGLGGAELATLFEDFAVSGAGQYQIHPDEFPRVFDALLGDQLVRPAHASNPRIHIYGPLEVRLLDHDRVILAGLNEGIWPQIARNDAFLNRAMRQELGMASPERRTGLAAHDFQQLMGKREVVLSRSQRVDKAPTVASRWLQRLLALVGEELGAQMTERGNRLLQVSARLDRTEVPAKRADRPCPVPPVDARPRSLAVTDIELWVRDPYALYAKRILNLQPLPPLKRVPDALLRGTLYHAILAELIGSSEKGLSAEAMFARASDIARRQIDQENLAPDLANIWYLRFCEIVRGFVDWEIKRRDELSIAETFCEIKGELPVAEAAFKLRATADRIDRLQDGSLIVLDYKTGVGPSLSQARLTSPPLAPQMALEGAIARAGGFEGIPAGSLDRLAFYRLRRDQSAGEQDLAGSKLNEDDLADDMLSALDTLVRAFQHPERGYVSRLHPFKENDILGDYDHLARTGEWSFADEGDGDG